MINRLRWLVYNLMVDRWGDDTCLCRFGPIGSRVCGWIDSFAMRAE